MATAFTRNIIRAPGRLYINPTNLNAAAPFGGTALGLARDLAFVPNAKASFSSAEEFGGQVTKAFWTGERPFIACVLREFDNDALNNIFVNTAVGAISSDRIIQHSPGDNAKNKPGYDLSLKKVKLLFAPSSSVRHPMILLYEAYPVVDEDTQIKLAMSQEVGIPMKWYAGVDGSGRSYALGKAQDLNSLLLP